ncbi:PFD5 protein, partial [Polypterus senegalus]
MLQAGLLGCEAVLSSMALMQASSIASQKRTSQGSESTGGQKDSNERNQNQMVLSTGLTCPPLVIRKEGEFHTSRLLDEKLPRDHEDQQTKKKNRKSGTPLKVAMVDENNDCPLKVQKNFICDHCYGAFRSSYHLKRHILTHTGEKPFACDVCEMRFIQRYHLERHKRVHSGEKPYQCDRCQQPKITQEVPQWALTDPASSQPPILDSLRRQGKTPSKNLVGKNGRNLGKGSSKRDPFPDADPWDPEALQQCPYDKSHQIRAIRFPYHLIKCGKNHPELAKQLKSCPFNARHLVQKHELSSHIANCEDRVVVTHDDCFENRQQEENAIQLIQYVILVVVLRKVIFNTKVLHVKVALSPIRSLKFLSFQRGFLRRLLDLKMAVNVADLSLPQLEGLKGQLDQETEFLTSSISQLKVVQTKYVEAKECVNVLNKENEASFLFEFLYMAHLPKMYVPGVLNDVEHVLVDIGTGYYVEKNVEESKDFFKRKIDFLTKQIEKIQPALQEKHAMKQAVVEVMNMKIQQLHAAQNPQSSTAKA